MASRRSWFRKARTDQATGSAAVSPIDVQAHINSINQGEAPPVPPEIQEAMNEQGMNTTAAFAPGDPIDPWFGFTGDPRQWNFQTGANIKTTPRNEPGLVPFATLRNIIEGYDIAMMCINHRIDDIRSLDWQILPADPSTSVDIAEQAKEARKLVNRLDGETPWTEWIAGYLRDVLMYDAGAIHKDRTLDGKVCGLSLIDGTTVSPLLDYYGRTPKAPAPAYFQTIQGVPWLWQTADDLIYRNFWPSNNSAYGTPPMEWLLLTANTDLRFQWHFLQFFTEGSLPGGLMEAPPDLSSPDQVIEFQQAWDAFIQGDQAKKVQIKWVPNGSNFTPIREHPFDKDFPMYLMNKVCAAYSVMPNDLGFTADVNRSTGENQVDVQFRTGTLPLVKHIEGIITSFLQEDMGLDDVKFSIDVGGEKEDRLVTAQAWKLYIEAGMASPDEARRDVLNLPTDPREMTPRFIMARSGAFPLKAITEIAGKVDVATGAPIPGSVEQIQPQNLVNPTEVLPVDLETAVQAEQAKEGTLPVQVREQKLAIAEAEATGAAKPVETAAASVEKTLGLWKASSLARVKRGRSPKLFDDVPLGVAAPIWFALSKATSKDEVEAAFSGKVPSP